MKKRVIALALTMSLLWTVTGNAVFAAPVEETEAATETVAEELTEAVADVEELDESEEVVEDVGETSETSGTCGENLTWELSEDYTLTISGTGEMIDFYNENEDIPWGTVIGQIRNLVIEEGVTSIGSGAFEWAYDLETVSIPNTVTSIGEYAFYLSESLKTITIPQSVVSIRDAAFYYTGLEEIHLSEGLKSIGEVAFKFSCLKEVTIPNSVTTIGEGAFECCEYLKKVTLPKGLKQISDSLFSTSSLEELNFPEDLEEIGVSAFYGTNIKSIKIPSGVKEIGAWAFSETAISSFEIPKRVTVIEYALFAGCENLTKVTIPTGIKEIEGLAFSETAIKNFEIPEGIEVISYGTFSKCKELTKVIIPESVTTIEAEAFANTGLKEITLPKAIKTIGKCAVGYDCELILGGEYDHEYIEYPVEGFTITGYLNTTAEKYAKDNDFQFNFLDIIIVDEKTDEVYVINSGEDLQIYCTGEFEDFISVEMDGVLVDSSNYTVREGSTIVTFTSAYLETLSPGKHTVTLNFVNDSVSTVINILTKQGAASQGSAGSGTTTDSGTATGIFSGIMNPKTGDNANMAMWLVLAVAAGLAGIITVKKRSK